MTAYCGEDDITEFSEICDERITKIEVKAKHIRELREAVQRFHRAQPGGEDGKRVIWKDNDSACITQTEDLGIIPQTTTVKKSHILQLRKLLDEYSNKQGHGSFSWSNNVSCGSSEFCDIGDEDGSFCQTRHEYSCEKSSEIFDDIRLSHILTLREAMNTVEARGELNCSSCETNWEMDPCDSECQTACETNDCQICETMYEGYECDAACQTSCQATCQLCESCDEVGCEDGCEVSCETSCQASCQSSSEDECTTTCQLSCQASCELTCQMCEHPCDVQCEIDETTTTPSPTPSPTTTETTSPPTHTCSATVELWDGADTDTTPTPPTTTPTPTPTTTPPCWDAADVCCEMLCDTHEQLWTADYTTPPTTTWTGDWSGDTTPCEWDVADACCEVQLDLQ